MRITKFKTELNDNHRPELVKEVAVNYPNEIHSPCEVVKMLNEVFKLNRQSEEFLFMVCFTAKGKIIAVFEISHGTINSTFCSPREIFQKALLCGAANIILCHNHPSFDCSPSLEDKKTHLNISDAAKLINIPLSDFIIIGGENYYSFNEHQ